MYVYGGKRERGVDLDTLTLIETGKQSGIIQFVGLGWQWWFHDLWHGFPILSIPATCYVHVYTCTCTCCTFLLVHA